MLRRGLLACLLATALLAGCSGPSDGAGPAAGTSTAPQVTTVVGAERPVAYTDTVHLLQPPAFTTSAPGEGEPLRIPIASFVGRSSFLDRWDVELKEDTAALAGQAVLWGEVAGTVVNDPIPTAEGCFWMFTVQWDELDPEAYRSMPCVAEGPTAAPGIRQLVFPIDVAGPWPAGTVLHFEFHVQDFGRGPDAEVNLLTASAAHDSTLTITGLQLPVDPSGLLAGAAATTA